VKRGEEFVEEALTTHTKAELLKDGDENGL
jgi:hypothetical protein